LGPAAQAHIRTVANVCSTADKSSAAINVVSAPEIGKYCVINRS
jgi:hypothetical protein